MKNAFLLLSILVTSSASANDANKESFYSAMASMDSNTAAFIFMVDQFLEAKCGVSQSITHLKKKALGISNSIQIELKTGNYESAKKLMSSLDCE